MIYQSEANQKRYNPHPYSVGAAPNLHPREIRPGLYESSRSGLHRNSVALRRALGEVPKHSSDRSYADIVARALEQDPYNRMAHRDAVEIANREQISTSALGASDISHAPEHHFTGPVRGTATPHPGSYHPPVNPAAYGHYHNPQQ